MTGRPGHSAERNTSDDDDTRRALAGLSAEQRACLAGFWRDRARGELTTALSFEFMLADLRAEAVPDPLLELAQRAIVDEHRHTDFCLEWARRIEPNANVEPELSGTRPLEFDGASARDNRLLRTVFGCCFSETVAVHVLTDSLRYAKLPSLRALNRLQLSDEVQHARLGWALLGWPGFAERERAMVRAHVPAMLTLLRSLWTSPAGSADERLLELGYLSPALVESAREAAVAEVILPGLDRLGICPS